MSLFSVGAILVGLSALFGYINYRVFRLPHTIGLVVIALISSLAIIGIERIEPAFDIAERISALLREIDFNDTLMHGMLSFLLFAGALHADFSGFKSSGLIISLMAVVGTLISTFVVGGSMWLILGAVGFDMPFVWALVFGALISPTDPVAVLGLFKTVAVPKSLQAAMTGESLFNDGVGVVVFTVVLAIALSSGDSGVEMSAIDIVELFAVEAGGGILLGLVAGYITERAMHRVDEPALEVLMTLALVMVTYAIALALEMSGPLAMVVAGLFIGNRGVDRAMSSRTRTYVQTFWELIDEILNSILFLLIGLEVLIVAERTVPFGAAIAAIPVALLARALSVGIPLAIVSPWQSLGPGAATVLIWGGLRGGIAVALALSLPDNQYKGTILAITYGVVVFSIIVQGLTVKPLVARVIRE